ncbi:kinase-like protein [Patellaria atrata CBS 101060]|uniref:Kinase-like protein n=1 Tax=Patellaria atrata CBS 101060 TaxID=1346257 RepID=A0A9P4VMM6_9PEZI|nr:kinase-like protein [Patellaria atrata CBS 101060]
MSTDSTRTTPTVVEIPVETLQSAAASAPISIDRPPLRSALSAASIHSSFSPGSALSSPLLNALSDITPLPSPLATSDSPGPWRRASIGRPSSRGSSTCSISREDAMTMLAQGTLSPSPSKKKKNYHGLVPSAVEGSAAQSSQKQEMGHTRNRSTSEFMPEVLHNVRPRHVTVSDAHSVLPTAVASTEPHLHREKYLAAQRGLIHPLPKVATNTLVAAALPTPPASNKSTTESEDEELKEEEHDIKYLVVRHGPERKRKLYRPIRELGRGTFSKVMLATSEKLSSRESINEESLNPKKLVAIKIVEHGPAGGADEERVELSLKREIEIMESISHPSVVHLKKYDFDETHALLVLSYCPGGDLFDLASQKLPLLTPGIVQRIFAELVAAVRYLHSEYIVHRDIKLETQISYSRQPPDVLLNIRPDELPSIESPQIYPYSLITLIDLGLSRRIPPPPASPLLQTRCGSEDYAAPEILLGQPYDGRATDAWALGVLLYALMEGRLPFDPPPGRGAGRSRAAHRIARCDWIWIRFGDEDGEWDAEKGRGWEGAREAVEALLKKANRGRKGLGEVAGMGWVKEGVAVVGGLRRRPEEDFEGVVR